MDRPPPQHAQDPQDQDETHGHGDHDPQHDAVDPALADQFGLFRHRDQGRFGHDRGESDGEAEGEQQPQGPAAGELVGEVLAHREHAQVQALEEQGDPHPHDEQSGDQL